MFAPAARAATLAACLAAAAPAAVAGPRAAPSLLDIVALWLAANFDLPEMAAAPALVTVPAADLVTMRYGADADVAPGDVVAIYDDSGATIFVSDGWTGASPAETSVLVHELVHHLQAESDRVFACPAARETQAYAAQDAWLGLFGESLESAFGIDRAALLVGTVCTY